AIAEARRIDHFGAVPAPVRTGELEVQPALPVDPDVLRRVGEKIRSRPDGLDARLDSPGVAGELDRARRMPAAAQRTAPGCCESEHGRDDHPSEHTWRFWRSPLTAARRTCRHSSLCPGQD